MGTARSADEFRVTGALENENTLMTDYWLDFVAARDGTSGFPPDSFALQDIRARLQQFSQKIHGLLESQAEIRCTLDITCQEIQRPSGSEIDLEGAGFPRYDPALSNQETKRRNELQPHLENRRPGLFARSRLFFSGLLRGNSLF